jgi:hypothetical protein
LVCSNVVTRKSRRRFVFAKENRHQRDFEMIPVCGLKHLARVLRGCKAFGQVSWLRETKSFLNTVARPRGIHTRFPILLFPRHPYACLTKERLLTRGTLTRAPARVNSIGLLVLVQVFCESLRCILRTPSVYFQTKQYARLLTT